MNKNKMLMLALIAFCGLAMLMFGMKDDSTKAMKRTVGDRDVDAKYSAVAEKRKKKDECTVTSSKEAKEWNPEKDCTPTVVLSDADDVGNVQELEEDATEMAMVKVFEVGKIVLTEDQIKAKTQTMEDNLEKAILKLKSQAGCLRLIGRTAVVGDIHGDYGALSGIIDELQLRLDSKEIDNVLFLGDFLDRFATRSTDTLIVLLDFFNRNDTVFILRGNHETLIAYFCSDADDEPVFRAIREKYPTKDVNPVDRFKESLPHTAILNDDTLAVHGGIPWYKSEQSNGMNRNVNVDVCLADFFSSSPDKKGCNAKEAVLCATWSDFSISKFLVIRPNTKRGCYESCLFGLSAVKEFFSGAAKERTGLDLKYLICGHDHRKGAFVVKNLDEVSVTTVISSPVLLSNCGFAPVASVALVQKGCAPQILFSVVI